MLKVKIEKLIKQIKKFIKKQKKEVCIVASSAVLLGSIGVGLAFINNTITEEILSNSTNIELEKNNTKNKLAKIDDTIIEENIEIDDNIIEETIQEDEIENNSV
ncbi:hypothetical protein [uncultured Clostridium sp.]|nr:hypothetical protein [uncultured Clostridium sp.]